jgi:hypothetical protein
MYYAFHLNISEDSVWGAFLTWKNISTSFKNTLYVSLGEDFLGIIEIILLPYMWPKFNIYLIY